MKGGCKKIFYCMKIIVYVKNVKLSKILFVIYAKTIGIAHTHMYTSTIVYIAKNIDDFNMSPGKYTVGNGHSQQGACLKLYLQLKQSLFQ